MSHGLVLAATWGDWKFTPATTTVDLIAASTNALSGALLARRPDHYKGYTVVGIILVAVLGGIGGGVARDVLLNKIPGPLLNPAYLFLAVGAGIIGYSMAYRKSLEFREGWFNFLTAFSLPWYAIVGAQSAHALNLPTIAAILIGVVGATTGRYLIDITSGVTPKQFVTNEMFVGTAVLAAVGWLVLDSLGLSYWPSTLIAFVIAFAFRLAAQQWKWEMPMPREGKPLATAGPARQDATS
jgi:uncharacterized membrane protein YeiH